MSNQLEQTQSLYAEKLSDRDLEAIVGGVKDERSSTCPYNPSNLPPDHPCYIGPDKKTKPTPTGR
ncbi:MAG: hypothetical protein KME17_01020 [Cyanosarcina radialis HA8281-LM2]|jgi:hypothetical protein|nr:hypothetical protein [Cyanosarcina radialis HA8281-LM2]